MKATFGWPKPSSSRYRMSQPSCERPCHIAVDRACETHVVGGNEPQRRHLQQRRVEVVAVVRADVGVPLLAPGARGDFIADAVGRRLELVACAGA